MPQAHQLGRYQLLDRIAFGGMAEIYRAKTFDSEGRARLVAVKRVLQHLTTDEDFIRMLVDEAKITALLDHPAIARVFEFSQAGDEYFIAMEYCDGKDTRSILEKQRQAQQPVAPEHVAWIIAHVAEGLHAAHTQADADGKPLQIVHRDVSPSNVLCSYGGDVKLCDFGIAKATLTRVQTRTGVIKGKVKYMSPEQAMGRKLDGRSDLFSLGTVMYEMLTLEAPFIAATEVELIFAVRDARKRDARELVPAIPESLNIILNRTMERQRTDRYQAGRELARDLRGWMEKNHPQYKRATFSRYMRALFKEEIEKELRLLEGWTLEQGDASKVGVNLIADVLGNDAPYRTFSAAGTDDSVSRPELPPQKTSIFMRDHQPPAEDAEPPLGDLHAQQTQILSRDAVRPAVASLHQRETMMLEGRAADELRSMIRGGLSLPSQPAAATPPALHEHATKLFEEAPPADGSGSTDLPVLQTRILSRGDPLPAVPPPPAPPPPVRPPPPPPVKAKARTPQDTKPDSLPRTFLDDSKESTLPKNRPGEDELPDFAGEDSGNPTDPRGPR